MSRKRALTQLTVDDTVQRKRRLFNTQPDPEESDNKRAGVITRMVLKNFMCHSHLEVRFFKNIVFVVGKNGSGKSAILTALVVGLSGKAMSTNRGHSVKSFVKAGMSAGSIEITMHNAGYYAYKQSQYGNEITIVRTINANGGGTYKVKSSLGQIISHSAREVQNILSYLNIQINNPVCILNQDTARNFLLSNDPKQKFVLFRKATGLEALAEECEKLKNSYHELKKIFQKKVEMYKNLKRHMEDYKQKLERHKNITNLQNKYSQLAIEVLWATVQELEKRLQEQEGVVAELQKLVDKYEDISNNRSQLEEDIRVKVLQIEQQITEIRQASTVQAGPIQEIDHQINRVKAMIFDNRVEKDQLVKSTGIKEKSIEAVEQEIRNFTENLSKIEQEKLERKREIATYMDQLKTIQQTLETTQNDLFQLKSSITKIEQEESDLSREKRQLQQQFDITKDDITNLKMKSSNSLHLYGRDMPQIIERINALESKFKKPPKGPLGAYVTIKDKKWAVAVEGFIGFGLLQSFTVDNMADNRLLIDIFDKNWKSGRPPMIITSKFIDTVHNVAPNLVDAPPDCVSLYNIIEARDPVVMNCLIDQLEIENILLIPSSNRAIELLSEQQNVPINCKQGVTIKGDRFYPDPDYRSYCSTYHQARFLEVDKEQIIKYNEEKLRQLHHKVVSVENQLNSVNINKKNQQEKLKEIIPKQQQLKTKSSALKKSLDELQITDLPESVNYEALENELKLLKDQISESSTRVGQIDLQMKTLKNDMQELENKKRDLLTNIQNFEDRLQPLVTEITRLGEEQKELMINKSFERRRIKEAQNNLLRGKETLATIKSELATQITVAGGEEKRVQTDKQTKQIETELHQLDEQLQELRSMSGDIKDVASKYKEIVDKHTQAMQLISSIEGNKQEMAVALQKRSKHFQNTQDYFSHYASYNFKQILDYRQYKGNINIDFDEKTLDLVVVPQHGSQGHTATTNLSGGERSFTTIAFLYSLWKVLSCPFYFLDEFDVYMDKVNRCKVIEILIHHAKQRSDMQFVFLTPQDISFIDDSDVSIHRLEDPKRGRENFK